MAASVAASCDIEVTAASWLRASAPASRPVYPVDKLRNAVSHWKQWVILHVTVLCQEAMAVFQG
jgi:hypothetical protein